MTLSAYSDYQALGASEKIGLVVVEAAQRLVGWAQVALSSVYQLSFPYQVITSITENGTALTPVASLTSIIAGSYYLDRVAKILYLKALDSTNPNGKFEACVFQLFFSNVPVSAPWDLATGFEVPFLPYVINTAEFGVELDNQDQVGLAIEGTGTISFLNDQSFWGALYDKVTFENQRVLIYSWTRAIPISEAKLIYRGRVQSKAWAVDKVDFNLTDIINELRAPVVMPLLSAIAGARIPDSLSQSFQRLLYGFVYSHRPTNVDQVLDGWPVTGTASPALSNAVVLGTLTTFLSELSPDDQVAFGDDTVFYTIKSVDSDTQLTLTENYTTPNQYDTSMRLKPAHPRRYMNRQFSICGHAICTPSALITAASDTIHFTCDDLSDFYEGDSILVGSFSTTVRRISGNLLTVTTALNLIPSVGTTIVRQGISNVYIDQSLLTLTRDYTYDAATGQLTLTDSAEVNVAPVRGITGTLTFTSGSRTVTGSGTFFKTEVNISDWIKISSQDTFFEVLSVDSDTQITLRTISSYTSSSTGRMKSPVYYDEGKTVLSLDTFGATDDGTSTGLLIKDGPSVVLDLLDRAGLSGSVNSASFASASLIAYQRVGFAIPSGYADKTAPITREVIGNVNKSIFGSLIQNADFEFEYVILSPQKPSTSTKLKKYDIVTFKVEANGENIIRTSRVNYLIKEFDQASLAPSQLQAVATSDNGNYLANSLTEFAIDTVLVDETQAQIMANRWALLYGRGSSRLTLTTKLQASRLSVGDKVDFEHDKMYERIGGSNKRKIASVQYAKKDFGNVEVEMDDLANCFSRVAIITPTGASSYTDASDDDKSYNGFITDSYGMQANDATTFGVNLIW